MQLIIILKEEVHLFYPGMRCYQASFPPKYEQSMLRPMSWMATTVMANKNESCRVWIYLKQIIAFTFSKILMLHAVPYNCKCIAFVCNRMIFFCKEYGKNIHNNITFYRVTSKCTIFSKVKNAYGVMIKRSLSFLNWMKWQIRERYVSR